MSHFGEDDRKDMGWRILFEEGGQKKWRSIHTVHHRLDKC